MANKQCSYNSDLHKDAINATIKDKVVSRWKQRVHQDYWIYIRVIFVLLLVLRRKILLKPTLERHDLLSAARKVLNAGNSE